MNEHIYTDSETSCQDMAHLLFLGSLQFKG